jgi:hypothetical protein
MSTQLPQWAEEMIAEHRRDFPDSAQEFEEDTRKMVQDLEIKQKEMEKNPRYEEVLQFVRDNPEGLDMMKDAVLAQPSRSMEMWVGSGNNSKSRDIQIEWDGPRSQPIRPFGDIDANLPHIDVPTRPEDTRSDVKIQIPYAASPEEMDANIAQKEQMVHDQLVWLRSQKGRRTSEQPRNLPVDVDASLMVDPRAMARLQAKPQSFAITITPQAQQMLQHLRSKYGGTDTFLVNSS